MRGSLFGPFVVTSTVLPFAAARIVSHGLGCDAELTGSGRVLNGGKRRGERWSRALRVKLERIAYQVVTIVPCSQELDT